MHRCCRILSHRFRRDHACIKFIVDMDRRYADRSKTLQVITDHVDFRFYKAVRESAARRRGEPVDLESHALSLDIPCRLWKSMMREWTQSLKRFRMMYVYVQSWFLFVRLHAQEMILLLGMGVTVVIGDGLWTLPVSAAPMQQIRATVISI